MAESNSRSSFVPSVYMIMGVVLGMFLGYKILPQMFPRDVATPTAEQVRALDAARAIDESRLAATLQRLPDVSEAHVSLSRPLPGASGSVSAVVTITANPPLLPEQAAQIAERTAQELGGADLRLISVYDQDGNQLNAESQVAAERKARWKGIALNVAKILGILASMITLRFILLAAGRSLGFDVGNGSGC